MLEGQAYNPHFTWVYRAFAFRPGQRFPSRRLDFAPVPIGIPVDAWVKTTVRLQHIEADGGSAVTRLAKYHE